MHDDKDKKFPALFWDPSEFDAPTEIPTTNLGAGILLPEKAEEGKPVGKSATVVTFDEIFKNTPIVPGSKIEEDYQAELDHIGKQLAAGMTIPPGLLLGHSHQDGLKVDDALAPDSVPLPPSDLGEPPQKVAEAKAKKKKSTTFPGSMTFEEFQKVMQPALDALGEKEPPVPPVDLGPLVNVSLVGDLETETVEATPKKLKAEWSMKAAEDWKNEMLVGFGKCGECAHFAKVQSPLFGDKAFFVCKMWNKQVSKIKATQNCPKYTGK